MVALALAAEALDLLTWNPASEANPIVAGLAYAPLVKVALMVLIVSVAVAIEQLHRYERVRTTMLTAAIVVGAFGAVTNVL